ncbi:hypothetical protein MNBD_ALPHA03-2015 [hydrothermal vent metagenome]|uniref:Uncharacterized protein n=1 Tax=hydrothermal vent metagenome TaxID=652676 RepID=A0A3B1BEH8_9ZZZZ
MCIKNTESLNVFKALSQSDEAFEPLKLGRLQPRFLSYWGGPIFLAYALNSALATLPDLELKVRTSDSAGPQAPDFLNVQNLVKSYSNYEFIFGHCIAGVSVSVDILREQQC